MNQDHKDENGFMVSHVRLWTPILSVLVGVVSSERAGQSAS